MPDDADPDALHAEARALARLGSTLPPGEVTGRARQLLTDCQASAAAASRLVLRAGYHRAAAGAALVGASASLRAGGATGPWITAAEEHAHVAGDSPLLAELWLLRGEEDGAAAHAREMGSPAAMRHVLAARGGSSRGPVSDAYVAVEWARLRLATGDVDAAAAHLVAALDACHALGLAGRLPFIAATTRDLPDTASSRQLAERLRS
jgi:hypothetical protein